MIIISIVNPWFLLVHLRLEIQHNFIITYDGSHRVQDSHRFRTCCGFLIDRLQRLGLVMLESAAVCRRYSKYLRCETFSDGS